MSSKLPDKPYRLWEDDPQPVPSLLVWLPLRLAWSGLARFSLAFAQLVSALGCAAVLIFGVYGIYFGSITNAPAIVWCSLIGTPVAFILQFATFVVFVRVAGLKSE